MMKFAGMKVVVHRPIIRVVQRSLYERWFTLPWRPFATQKEIVIPAIVGPDDSFKAGDTLHCGEGVYRRLLEITKLTRVGKIEHDHLA